MAGRGLLNGGKMTGLQTPPAADAFFVLNFSNIHTIIGECCLTLMGQQDRQVGRVDIRIDRDHGFHHLDQCCSNRGFACSAFATENGDLSGHREFNSGEMVC